MLGLIPARGGSKGIPGKNLVSLAGRPLISWTINEARAAAAIDDLVVTTDDDEIARVAAAAGARVPFLRPMELSGDTASMTEVVEHALRTLADEGEPYGWLLLLQPTSPLRTGADIEAAFARLRETGGRGVVSVCPVAHSPLLAGTLPPDGRMQDFITRAAAASNRQEMRRYYRLNGAVYLADVAYWREQGGFLGPQTYALVMPEERSVDVDSPLDLAFAEYLLARRGSN